MRITAFFVVSLLLMGATSFAADDQKTLAGRSKLLSELHHCLDALPPVVDTAIMSPCGGKAIAPLAGITVDVLVKELGKPTWCAAVDGLNRCDASKRWGWSFYRLPKNTTGGGHELVCELDESRACSVVRWIVTE